MAINAFPPSSRDSPPLFVQDVPVNTSSPTLPMPSSNNKQRRNNGLTSKSKTGATNMTRGSPRSVTVGVAMDDDDARQFDQVLKKLETTKQKQKKKKGKTKIKQQSSMPRHPTDEIDAMIGPPMEGGTSSRSHADSSDNFTFDSRNDSSAGAHNNFEPIVNSSHPPQFRSQHTLFRDDDSDDGGTNNHDHNGNGGIQPNNNQQQLFETRQCFVDRRVESPSNTALQDSVDSFIEKAQSGGGGRTGGGGRYDGYGERLSGDEHDDEDEGMRLVDHHGEDTRLFEEGLPDAILKLDRRHAIPTPRHKNDVLLEIEASTVDRRELMVRPGVRCTESLPQGVETTSTDCIGRVVQLTTHARAVYGIGIDDRVAALYPFEYKDGLSKSNCGKRSKNHRYALVDAGYCVAVPKHVDAAEASCMIRLYLSAFQSISRGMGLGSMHDRYGYDPLAGKSVLVQDGTTELGRALIDLAGFLGASRIFATGPTETHSLLVSLGAIPLGAETFGWELFIEEKLSLVLVQDMPTADNFETFMSILDENRGNLVYIHHGHKQDDDDLGIPTDDVSCDGLQFQELSKKIREAFAAAAFGVRLSCSPRYAVYEGAWPSCKENPNQFKEDLRYLFTLLGRGSLKPNVSECINLEEVGEVQDRIELLGKKGTIVCLPKSATPLYEKKAAQHANVVAPPSPANATVGSFGAVARRDPQGFPVLEHNDIVDYSDTDNDPVNTYASDAGYVRPASQTNDFLSDFHCMYDARRHTGRGAISDTVSMPALPEATSYSQSGTDNFATNGGNYYSDRQQQNYYHNDASSTIASTSQSSATNFSIAQTALSDGALRSAVGPLFANDKEDPPLSIQFRDKRSRRYHAYQRQKRAKETWRKTQQRNTKATALEGKKGELDSHDGLEKSASTSPTAYNARRMRREARKREQAGAPENEVEEEIVAQDTEAITAPDDEAEQVEQSTARTADERQVTQSMINAPDDEAEQAEQSNARTAEEGQATQSIDKIKFKRRSHAVRRALYTRPRGDSDAEARGAKESRNEDECGEGARDNSFNTLMSKWKNVDDLSRQSEH